MKKILLTLIAILVPYLHSMADNTLFPYPEAPQSLSTIDERCNYVIERFWDRCNFKQSLSAKVKLQQAFNDYIGFMPFADAEVVHTSVDKLLDKIKKSPEILLHFAKMAEGTMYSDTARLVIDEVYVKFAKAVAENKKIKAADRAHFSTHEKVLSSCQAGMIAPDLEFIKNDGTKARLSELPQGHILLLFTTPDCFDCSIARARFSADYSINNFIKKGQLNVVNIFVGDANDPSWKEIAGRLPDNWISGSSLQASEVFDLRRTPSIYYLNPDRKILSKTMTADQLINAFRTINSKSKD